MSSERWGALLAAAAGAHLGFQLTVSWLVYPALQRNGLERPDAWAVEHARHSRRITPLVVLVYGAAAIVGIGVLVAAPSPARVASVCALAVAGALTAAIAAPLHGRLGRDATPDPRLLTRLRRVDLLRSAAAAVALALAVIP